MYADDSHQQVIYQADPGIARALQSMREGVHIASQQYMNQPVRVQTMDGHVFEGTIVNVDTSHLYLSISPDDATKRGWLYDQYVYNNVILPLVLYELLVITLLYT